MAIETLKCPLNEKGETGPITHLGLFPDYTLTKEDIRLYEKLAPLPQPKHEPQTSNT